MLTAHEQILDGYVRHQLYVLRFAGGLRNIVSPLLLETESALADLIITYATKNQGLTIFDRSTRKTLKELKSDVLTLRKPAWQAIEQDVTAQLKTLAIMEVKAGARVIEGAVPVVLNMSLPSAQHLHSVAMSTPFDGAVLAEWFKTLSEGDANKIVKQVRLGIVEGETPIEIARRIVKEKGPFADKTAARKALRDLESVLLTASSNVQNAARQALYDANRDVVDEELYVATLDSSTTPVCMDNDGKRFKPGEGPMPPLHFRCRSLRVPGLNEDNMGDRPFNPTTEKQMLREFCDENGLKRVSNRKDLPYGTKTKYDAFSRAQKRELIGQMPAKTSYGEFFNRQSKAFQNDTLGPTRAQWVRDGKLKIGNLTSGGRTLTIKELEARFNLT